MVAALPGEVDEEPPADDDGHARPDDPAEVYDRQLADQQRGADQDERHRSRCQSPPSGHGQDSQGNDGYRPPAADHRAGVEQTGRVQKPEQPEGHQH
ncbi:MAG TPA: hypothetical protein VIT42_04875 [Microlunatus sp.]